MVVVQAGVTPLLNIITVCGMRMQSMQEVQIICQENFGSHCRVLVHSKAEKLLDACVLMHGKQSYLFTLEKLFYAVFIL